MTIFLTKLRFSSNRIIAAMRAVVGKLPTAYVRAKFADRSFTRLRNIEGVPKFQNWGTCPRRRPISGQFVVRGKNCSFVRHVHAKFEDRSFSVCEILRGPKISRLGHVPQATPT